MIIVIDDYETDIARENASFLLSKGETKRQISPYRISAFHLKKPCTISSPALLLAAEFQIPFLLFNNAGRVKARIWQPNFGSHVQVRHQQMAISQLTEALTWVKQGIADKAEGQMRLLRWLGNRLPSQYKQLEAAVARIQKWYIDLQQEAQNVERIRLAEAQAARVYWETMFEVLQVFETANKRSRRPANDPINSLVNYGYGMLYSEVETATLTAGLDPHIGFLHREEYGKPAFVFDAIEPFRPWVDRLVVDLLMAGKVKSTWFEIRQPELVTAEIAEKKKRPQYWLSREGKKAFIPAYFKMLNERVNYQNRRIKRKDQIQLRLTNFAQYLLHEFNQMKEGE